MSFKVTPKSLILGLAQAAKSTTIPIKLFAEAGELFGYTSNTIRVNVARLVTSEVLISDERGFYQLTNKANPVSQHIENWRTGDERRADWQGDWLACLPPGALSKNDLSRSHKALNYLGFASTSLDDPASPLWLRPNNLSLPRPALITLLRQLGLSNNIPFFIASDFDPSIDKRWREGLWPVKTLNKRYQQAIKALQLSQKCLSSAPLDQALVESFIKGSEVINLIITDPMLPDALMSPLIRDKLIETMLAYDDFGQRVWAKKFTEFEIRLAPANLSSMSFAV